VQAVGDDQSAGVDEGVARPTRLLVELEQGVEGVAGRLAGHPLPDPLVLRSHDQGQGEDLADALHREADVGVADHVHGSVHRRDGHAELVRVHGRQAGDVLRQPTAAHLRGRRLLGAPERLLDLHPLIQAQAASEVRGHPVLARRRRPENDQGPNPHPWVRALQMS
jgi:hypothetical protein